jgi:aspartate racemase
MKTIGILGGMSWESTLTYYQAINRGVADALGGLHSARICLYSVDFAQIEQLQQAGDWDALGVLLADAARAVAAGGAELLLIATNTMHRVAPAVASAVDIPLLHIADATGERLLADGRRRVGLLGTRFTMEQDFYRGRLATRHGLEVLVPDAAGRERVHRIIYEELCRGRITEASRAAFVDIVEALAGQGAEAVVLGCTEIGLLLRPQDTAVPLYDTTLIHADAAVRAALG